MKNIVFERKAGKSFNRYFTSKNHSAQKLSNRKLGVLRYKKKQSKAFNNTEQKCLVSKLTSF